MFFFSSCEHGLCSGGGTRASLCRVSLAAEHGLQARGLQHCRTWVAVVAAHRLSCPVTCIQISQEAGLKSPAQPSVRPHERAADQTERNPVPQLRGFAAVKSRICDDPDEVGRIRRFT